MALGNVEVGPERLDELRPVEIGAVAAGIGPDDIVKGRYRVAGFDVGLDRREGMAGHMTIIARPPVKNKSLPALPLLPGSSD